VQGRIICQAYSLIIQIVAGAIGGNIAGAASKDVSLGTAGNTIAGAIGGGVGGQLLGTIIPLLANTASTIDIGALVGQAAGGPTPDPKGSGGPGHAGGGARSAIARPLWSAARSICVAWTTSSRCCLFLLILKCLVEH
jgi:hypothetical protein